MHKLIEYVCGELDELEKKAAKGSMSMSELEYGSKLADFKKNLLKGEMLYDEVMGDDEYSERMMNARGVSYARGRGRNARRDSMGRYSRSADDMVAQLRDLMDDAPDEAVRKDIERLVRKVEQM